MPWNTIGSIDPSTDPYNSIRHEFNVSDSILHLRSSALCMHIALLSEYFIELKFASTKVYNFGLYIKVLSLLEACFDLISPPSTSMKIQIIGRKITENLGF